MRKNSTAMISAILAAVMVLSFSVTCYAEEYSLSSMSTEELEELQDQVEEELDKNHKVGMTQKPSIEKTTKQYVEEIYGKENVKWALTGHTYTREWEYYTYSTRADIIKEDGGEAKYDIYSEVIKEGRGYTLVYLKVGTEEVLNNRAYIADKRVLRILESKETEE